MPTCCRIRLCCGDDEAAADLAAHEGIPVEAAAKIHAGYQLVPSTLEAVGAAQGTAVALAAQKELVQLHKLLKARLSRILEDLGHGKVTLQETT